MTRADWEAATPKCDRRTDVDASNPGHICGRGLMWVHKRRSAEDIRPVGVWICARHPGVTLTGSAAAVRRAAAAA